MVYRVGRRGGGEQQRFLPHIIMHSEVRTARPCKGTINNGSPARVSMILTISENNAVVVSLIYLFAQSRFFHGPCNGEAGQFKSFAREFTTRIFLIFLPLEPDKIRESHVTNRDLSDHVSLYVLSLFDWVCFTGFLMACRDTVCHSYLLVT